jgi:dehydrodolichyl diphosphate syntase complex subunit NUS1
MASVAKLSLRAIHYIYAFVVFLYSCWKRLTWTTPLPLTAARRRTPKHLALLLVTGSGDVFEDIEQVIVRSVLDSVVWCCASGIEKLTVYEEHGNVVSMLNFTGVMNSIGTLLKFTQHIRECLSTEHLDENSSESEMEYPLTPPPSDHSGSRPISPQHELSPDLNTNTIHVIGKQVYRKATTHAENLKQLFRTLPGIVTFDQH